MPFKIVQTKEADDVTELSIVPSDWEASGKLFWPRKHVKNRTKLIKDDRSKPSPEWDIINCVLKRSNLMSYKQAVAEIRVMEEHTDTDNDNFSLQPIPIIEKTNFEDLAEILQNEKSLPIVNEGPTASQTNNNVIIIDQPTTESSELYQLCTTEYNTQIIANQALILEKINNIYVILDTVIENQKNIGHKLASLSVEIDHSNFILQKMEQPVTLLKDASPVENESFELRAIENIKQLEGFESVLLDHAQRTKLKKLLSILCSVSDGNGVTCAYKLLDTLFSRDFLCQCSWSGGSRNSSSSKFALKDHKLFIKFFFEMISSWDTSFTMDKIESFFETVLKNAMKRKAMKNLRASTKRTRKCPKKATNTIDTQPPQDNQSNEPINEDNLEHAENAGNMEVDNEIESEESELDLC